VTSGVTSELHQRGTKPLVAYHSSSTQGLSIIRPSESTHGQPWVYACRDLEISAVFLSGWLGDLSCQVGRDEESGLPYITERFVGAFEPRYAGHSGSIYELCGTTFSEGPWPEELVGPQPVAVRVEHKVDDAAQYLLDLKKQRRIIIERYPHSGMRIPLDNMDLLDRPYFHRVLDRLAQYHPNVVAEWRRRNP